MPYSFRSARMIARPVTGDDTPEVEAVYAGNRELLLLLDRENDPALLARRFAESGMTVRVYHRDLTTEAIDIREKFENV